MGIAVSIVVILILSILLFRRTKATTNQRPPLRRRPAKAKPDPQFHAVSLRFSGSACEAAKALEGKRFLSSAAPRIPLPDCDVLECKCRFIHHKDRRDGDDRRDPYRQSIGDTGKHEKERRHRGDRRSDD